MARTLIPLLALSSPALARDAAVAGEGGFPWQPVAQTLLALGLLVLLARGTDGEARDDRRRARGRGLLSSLSSGSW